ncbi:MAG: dihydrofolate reductase [Intrasporangiaceae bacterium]|nr:dihydrofolate reductase [Intrasporangiaceae bacterium]
MPSEPRPRITLIAAVARNGVIGAEGGMPWRIPEDFAFFKRTTMGHPMVMGRATFDSIGRPLPGRRSIVITRSTTWSHEGVEVVGSLEEALDLATSGDGGEDIMVAGGGQVYRQTMPLAHRLLVTEVDLEPEGDVTFPRIDALEWVEVSRDQRDGFAFVEYQRRQH